MPEDLQKYTSQTRFRLVIGFLAILFIVGLGLVWGIYGREAALLGLFCLLGTGIPAALIVLFLFGLDLVVKRQDR